MPLQQPKYFAHGIGLNPALHSKSGHCQPGSTFAGRIAPC